LVHWESDTVIFFLLRPFVWVLAAVATLVEFAARFVRRLARVGLTK